MDLIGWKWDSVGLDKMVTLHWIINIILVWYYSFLGKIIFLNFYFFYFTINFIS